MNHRPIQQAVVFAAVAFALQILGPGSVWSVTKLRLKPTSKNSVGSGESSLLDPRPHLRPRLAGIARQSDTFVHIRAVQARLAGSDYRLSAQRVTFYPDDPLTREPETQDASKVQAWDIGLTPDLLLNLFTTVGDRRTNVRAQNINTIDEVPDSSWFTNRIYTRPLKPDEIARGPNVGDPPASGRWLVVRGKSAGAAPGFTARDEKGQLWFLSFDGRDNPVAPTGAAVVASKLFWALGYNQVETFLTSVRPDAIQIDPAATLREHGTRRPVTMRDVQDVLDRSARSADGSYRAFAGRAVPGRPLGGFRYHGTRPDDPNDIVDHEHRRELRALKVFGAWVNLVDMKAGNTLDALITENGRGIVRHYLQDVGSTFGTGANAPRDGDEGFEYLAEAAPLARRLFTLGLYVSPWQTADYADSPEIGRFEADTFEPEEWRPRVPVAALRHARPDDNLWAALRVMAFTPEQIRAAVKTGGYTDPAAEKLLEEVLLKRRDKIGRAYLSRVNPLTRFALSDSGSLSFENPAVRAGYAESPSGGYEVTWASFNNGTGESRPIGARVETREERVDAPPGIDGHQFVEVSIRATKPVHAPWSRPVKVCFRRSGRAWQLVGIDR